MPSECPGNIRDQDVRNAGGAPPPGATAGLRRVTIPAAIAAVLVAVVGVGLALPGKSAAVIVVAATATLVAAGGIAFIFIRSPESIGPDIAALLTVGFAGVALAALLAGVLSVSDLVSQDVGAAFVFAVGAFTRSARIAQDQARVAQARAEDLLTQLRASQAAQAEAAALTERARLAREIHDILAHALSGLILALDTMELLGRQAETGAGTMERMMEQVSRGQRIARDGLTDTRRAIAALRGDELPGPALLDRLVRDATAATGVRATLSVTGPERPLPPEVGLALYRTAQEALTNTAKYAGQGADAELRLAYEQDAVELVIEDSRSADPPGTTAGLTFGGYGLTGMRERVEMVGGSFHVESTPGKGTTICAQIPVTNGKGIQRL